MSWGIQRQTTLGLATVAALVAGLGIWGTFGSLAGAVVSTGQVEPESRAQIIEHADGGIVAQINVRDGDKVSAGDILLSLDGNELKSNGVVLTSQITEYQARSARLAAEQIGADSVVFSDELTKAAVSEQALAEVLQGQVALFDAKKRTYEETINSYREQQSQKESEVEGLRGQSVAIGAQLELMDEELKGLNQLLEKQLIDARRVAEMRRARAALMGQKAAVDATIAASLGQVSQIDIEILRLTATRQQEAVGELRDVENKIAELSEQRKALEKKISRLDLRAPLSGIVHGLQIHTIGSVLRPAEAVMYVIPQNETLTITAKIDTSHVDSVFVGQKAVLRFSSFDARTTPELQATVLQVSADVVTDQRTGQQYYTAELEPLPGQMAVLEGKELLPGMPVEVYIQTGSRSPLSYLLKPFTDYVGKAFKE